MHVFACVCLCMCVPMQAVPSSSVVNPEWQTHRKLPGVFLQRPLEHREGFSMHSSTSGHTRTHTHTHTETNKQQTISIKFFSIYLSFLIIPDPPDQIIQTSSPSLHHYTSGGTSCIDLAGEWVMVSARPTYLRRWCGWCPGDGPRCSGRCSLPPGCSRCPCRRYEGSPRTRSPLDRKATHAWFKDPLMWWL